MKYAPERVHRPTDMKVLNRKAIISLFNTKTPITVADIVEKIKNKQAYCKCFNKGNDCRRLLLYNPKSFY